MEEMYYYWLHNVAGIGRVTFRKILEYMSPKELYECSIEKHPLFLTEKQRMRIKESKKYWDVSKEWELLKNRGIHVFGLGEKNYPEKLSHISDPPPVLYHKGKKDIYNQPSVAVIGARACSNYGYLAAKELGKELAAAGVVIVSGMARGIDSICQKAGLEWSGESIGVLGSGVEICYPPENQELFQQLQSQGALVSENLPFTKPGAALFPLRNRIISGLADVVVVIESREKSGTQITVDMALEQGKEVYAMPGRITDPVSRGCNKLIKQGAGMMLSPKEFVEEIAPILKIKYQRSNLPRNNLLNWEEKMITDILEVSLKTIEEIYQEARKKSPKVTLNKIMEIVLELQMKNLVNEEGGYYRLNKWIS
mgnify:CR=1 FL=1